MSWAMEPDKTPNSGGLLLEISSNTCPQLSNSFGSAAAAGSGLGETGSSITGGISPEGSGGGAYSGGAWGKVCSVFAGSAFGEISSGGTGVSSDGIS